jgi:hypothetical protein
MNDIQDYQTILFHKNVAKAQRSAYKNHLKAEQLRDKILIELDYKQNIKIGLSPRQIKEFVKENERKILFYLLFAFFIMIKFIVSS